MTRIEARNQAFILVFEKIFSDESIDDIVLLAEDSRDFELDADGYIINAFRGVYDNVIEIDEIIEKYLTNWTIDRISKVSLAVLRLAIFEIKYMDDIPESVSIDEAVELCKKYSTIDDASFVNGLLGSIVRA